MLKANAGALVPLQMADGSKLWRWAGKIPKGDAAAALLDDLIAQGLARAQWCANGWEELKRTPGLMAVTTIEGRCK